MLKKCLFFFIALSINLLASDLDRIIPPEIKNDDFSLSIYQLAKTEAIKTVLEIGSSSGDGSTEAFVKGISENPNNPTLFCMEVSRPRFLALQTRYKHNPSVVCYNVSSVPLAAFPTEAEVREFMRTVNTSLRNFTEAMVIGWLRQDIAYIKEANVPDRGIELIKSEQKIQYFDMVLIDGSEFTGKAELELVYGAKFILLDDTRAFKNYYNFKRLSADPAYKLIKENQSLRNGYAIFKKIN